MIPKLLESIPEEDQACIDRDEENQSILTFQKTGDLKLLEEIYKRRIPTLKKWTSDNFFPGLTSSEEDFFEEMTLVFLKAADKYDPDFGASFNTCLFSFLVNRIKNLNSARHAKKRCPKEYEGALSSLMLSLDYEYSEKGGHSVRLVDLIEQKPIETDETHIKEMIDIVSDGDEEVADVLTRISRGSTMSGALREICTRIGKVETDKKLSEEELQVKIAQEVGTSKFVLQTVQWADNTAYWQVDLPENGKIIMRKIKSIKQNKKKLMKTLGY